MDGFKGDFNCKDSLFCAWKSRDADSCHLVRVHSDDPCADVVVVVTAGVVPAGEGAWLPGLVITPPTFWEWNTKMAAELSSWKWWQHDLYQQNSHNTFCNDILSFSLTHCEIRKWNAYEPQSWFGNQFLYNHLRFLILSFQFFSIYIFIFH